MSNIDSCNKPFLENGVRPHRYALALFVKRRVIEKGKPVKIITAVREPVERNISSFFQDFKAYNGGKGVNAVTVEEAIQNFIKYYPHNLADTWFQKDFMPVLGLTPADIRFDIEKKVGSFGYGSFKFLILRTDLDNDEKTMVIRRFTDCPEITLENRNAYEEKEYRSFYRQFKQQIKLPDHLIDEIYSKSYVRLFFTEKEINGFREGWKAGETSYKTI